MAERNLKATFMKAAKKLTEEDVEGMKIILEDDIEEDVLSKVTTGFDLFKELKKLGMVCQEKKEEFVELFRSVERNDLVEMMVEDGVVSSTSSNSKCYTLDLIG